MELETMPNNNHQSKDEVDFIIVPNYNNNNNNNDDNSMSKTNGNNKISEKVSKSVNSFKSTEKQVPNKESPQSAKMKKRSGTESLDPKKNSTKERLSLFSFGRKMSQKPNIGAGRETVGKPAPEKTMPVSLPSQMPTVPIGTPPRTHKFVKSSSIARLLGNTYNAKKFEKEEQKRLADTKFNTYGGRRRLSGPYMERFKRRAKDDADLENTNSVTLNRDSNDLCGGGSGELVSLAHFHEERSEELGTRTLRSISRGLGKLWFRRSHSVDISTPDPEFKVSYLGNVLTGWAKGEGCVEKQLNTLWRNYTQNNKPDVIMRVKVCASGLKATTRQHGLTEYWANRITHCCAPTNYPRVFCWIYRHEGRKLKHELRCHAVLCSKEKVANDICNQLKENLERALREFKREKILKQNARLSLANAAYENPSLPRRKILLSVGGNNYRPPLERSKSAPKLMSIEEAIGEEEGDEIEETNEPEMKACCQKDSLYPAMTLGRRRCRRGHSIRRTGKIRSHYLANFEQLKNETGCCSHTEKTKETSPTNAEVVGIDSHREEEQHHSFGSDDSDDFEKLLKLNNYDSTASLANELLPYFDMQLNKNTSCSLSSLTELKDDEEPLSLTPTINSDPSADPLADFKSLGTHDMDGDQVVGLRRNGVCSDGEEDYMDADDMYFRQAAILNLLHRNSMRKMAQLSLSSDESSIETSANQLQYNHHTQSSISSTASSTASTAAAQEGVQCMNNSSTPAKLLIQDSDEGSISSGCETASTVTANQDDLSFKYRQTKQLHDAPYLSAAALEHAQLQSEQALLAEEPITAEEIYQRLESRLQGRHNSDATTFSSSSSITLKIGASPTASLNGLDTGTSSGNRSRRMRSRQSAQREQCVEDSDSECSDESGYVEFQGHEREKREKPVSGGGASAGSGGKVLQHTKPEPPPKPMPRKFLNTSTATAV